MKHHPTAVAWAMSAVFALVAGPLAGLLAGPLAGQRKKKPKYPPGYWKTDPYTKNEKALMQKAGYLSFGPFTWGDDHDTNAIVRMFSESRFLFVETAHFRIASTLPAYKVPRRKKLERKLLKAELTTLKELFPDLKPNRLTLDPWLRLHLFARRLEDLYADFSKKLGVTDKDFPQESRGRLVATKKTPGKYMGQGPYLGMRGKLLIMLMQKGGNLTRYAARAKGGIKTSGGHKPQRHYFVETGSMFFGTACECANGGLFNDHALRCHVVFNMVQSLIDGYKEFYFVLPVWVREGVSHWYLRNIDPTEHCFTGLKDRSNTKRYDPKWDVKIRQRLKHKDFTPAAKVTKYMAFEDLTFGDHMAIWSRIDYLMSLGDEKFAKFMDIMKNRIPVEAGQIPTARDVLAQQDRALQQAYGFDWATLDGQWQVYVRKTYPSK